MAVCLTSTVTSQLLLLFFSTYLFPSDQGWETLYPRYALFSPGRHGNPKTQSGREWNSSISSITGRQRGDCCVLWVTQGNVLAEVQAGGLVRSRAETWMFTLLSWHWYWLRFSSERLCVSSHCFYWKRFLQGRGGSLTADVGRSFNSARCYLTKDEQTGSVCSWSSSSIYK